MARYSRPEKGNLLSSNTRISSSRNAAFDVVLHHVRSSNNGKTNGKRSIKAYDIDETDLQIIGQMLAGYSFAEIARKTGIPLSTVQRRSQRILQEGFVVPVTHLNFKKFGLRRGMLLFRCKNASLHKAVDLISRVRGVESASAYLGSLDVIANVVYADSKDVLDIISEVEKFDLINGVTWSEEIHSSPI